MTPGSTRTSLILAIVAGFALGSNPSCQPQTWMRAWASGSLRSDFPGETTHETQEQAEHDAAPSKEASKAESKEDAVGSGRPADLQALDDLDQQLFDPQGDLIRPLASTDLNTQDAVCSPEEQFLGGLHMPDMPVTRDPRIAEYLRFFTESESGRGIFGSWLERHERYRELFRAALAQRGLPSALEAVAFVESGLWPKARSHAGAAGLWQLMPATARSYGLVVDRSLDERFDPAVATAAAVTHLGDLYEDFQSWELTLAAYNAGTGAIVSRIERFGTKDFWELSGHGGFPRETRLYVPKVVAVAIVLRNLDVFGFEQGSPLLGRKTLFGATARSSNMWSTASLGASPWASGTEAFNEESGETYAYLRERDTGQLHTVSRDGEPRQMQDAILPRALNDLPREENQVQEDPLVRFYVVQEGDALESIARHEKVTAQELIKWNHLKDPSLLSVGQKLRIVESKSAPADALPAAP